MPFCNNTVTVVHHEKAKNGDSYTCHVIVGVSWHGKRGMAPTANGGFAPRDEYIVRIPAERVPDVLPKPGDFIVKGILAEYTGRCCLAEQEYFEVSFVGDNRRGLLPHLVVKNVDRKSVV